MPGPDAQFWQQRFESHETPWDRGEASPQLEAWLRGGHLEPVVDGSAHASSGDETRLTRVLVPGCGSGYEVSMLAERGFDVTAVDYASAAVERTRERLRALLRSAAAASMTRAEVVEADLLAYSPAVPFDAIYEQTCLCALHPDHWEAYARRLAQWLRSGGRLFALFVQIRRAQASAGFIQGPPYHCDINAMRALFPSQTWVWPKPPYAVHSHPAGFEELAVELVRR